MSAAYLYEWAGLSHHEGEIAAPYHEQSVVCGKPECGDRCSREPHHSIIDRG